MLAQKERFCANKLIKISLTIISMTQTSIFTTNRSENLTGDNPYQPAKVIHF